MIVVISDETVEAFRNAAGRLDDEIANGCDRDRLADLANLVLDIAGEVFDAPEEQEVIQCGRPCRHFRTTTSRTVTRNCG